MLDIIPIFLLNPPTRLKTVGEILSRCSFALIVAGLFLRISLVAVDVVQSTSGIRTASATLATLYPSLPSWFIPEEPFGFALILGIGAIGLYASDFARKIERIY